MVLAKNQVTQNQIEKTCFAVCYKSDEVEQKHLFRIRVCACTCRFIRTFSLPHCSFQFYEFHHQHKIQHK